MFRSMVGGRVGVCVCVRDRVCVKEMEMGGGECGKVFECAHWAGQFVFESLNLELLLSANRKSTLCVYLRTYLCRICYVISRTR